MRRILRISLPLWRKWLDREGNSVYNGSERLGSEGGPCVLVNTYQTWRELLGNLLEAPYERQRVATLLGVHAWTLMRWVKDEVNPRPYKLRRLPDLFPEKRDEMRKLITAEFPAVWSDTAENGVGVSAAYYTRLLAAYAHTEERFSSWSIFTLGLQQVLARLDTGGQGVEISILQCTPPNADLPVQSLYERTGIGSTPWERNVETHLLFLGTESLAGYVVSHGHPKVVQNIAAEQTISLNVNAGEISAAAYPIQRWGRTAGCLVVVSTQPNFFEEELSEFLAQYADIFALAFSDREFYRASDVCLRVMPSVSFQQHMDIDAQFRSRVLALQQSSLAPFTQEEAERQVRQQLEAILLQKI